MRPRVEYAYSKRRAAAYCSVKNDCKGYSSALPRFSHREVFISSGFFFRNFSVFSTFCELKSIYKVARFLFSFRLGGCAGEAIHNLFGHTVIFGANKLVRTSTQ